MAVFGELILGIGLVIFGSYLTKKMVRKGIKDYIDVRGLSVGIAALIGGGYLMIISMLNLSG
ncbi:hypothetical protein [Ulvibacterium marinum]|uniref:Uncharacterized protein n=1 Tax=Ulvibacterium marinum TaxID=2419782 RepID=A0A3B0BU26_9FLAO|nr:hypothetical protein [Ulvibacterium marinum]RKN76823.1 hypothetical protein D7Z94_23870 [Ulvibacterium marinum]